MINTKEIKKLLIENDLEINDVASCIGRTYNSTYLKLHNKAPMNLSEANKLQKLLRIADCDFGLYFLYRGEEL